MFVTLPVKHLNVFKFRRCVSNTTCDNNPLKAQIYAFFFESGSKN